MNSDPILGGVYNAYIPLSENNKHVQYGERPVIVIQNVVGNCHSPIVIVIPLTGAEHNKSNMPTHVFLSAKECGLQKNSIALCEQPLTLSKDNLRNHIATLSQKYKEKVGFAHAIAAPTMIWISDEALPKLKRYLLKKNTTQTSQTLYPDTRVLARV